MSKHIVLVDNTKQGLLEQIMDEELTYFNKSDEKLLLIRILCDHDGYRAHLKVVNSYDDDDE
jgi:hypothetical protein